MFFIKNNNLCNFESKDVLPEKPVNTGPLNRTVL